MPIPAYYALRIADPLEPEIALPHGIVTPDGMAVEFTVTPTNSVDTIIEYLRDNLRTTQQMLAANGCGISVEPYFHTDPYYIEQLPERFGKQCSLQILGCAPDVCVYDDIVLPKRPDPRTYPWRTSGGHIHVQIGQQILQDNAALCYTIAAMDYVLGTAATYLCPSEQAFQRKILYGSAGMMRSNYDLGTLEYRTLSGQALIQTEEVARMMFTAAQNVCGIMMDIYDKYSQREAIGIYKTIFGGYSDIVNSLVPAINTHNVDRCRAIQDDIGNRLSEYAILDAVIHDMQSYVLPQDFDLHWRF